MNLNEQQMKFCDEYLIDHDATAAAERAGYTKNTSKKGGERLLANVLVSDYIDQLLHEQDDIRNKRYIIDQLKEIVKRCMQSNPVRKQDEHECIQYEFDADNAIKALKLLGMQMGMFGDKMSNIEPRTEVNL